MYHPSVCLLTKIKKTRLYKKVHAVLFCFKNNHVSLYPETIIHHMLEKDALKKLYFSFVKYLFLYLLILMSMWKETGIMFPPASSSRTVCCSLWRAAARGGAGAGCGTGRLRGARALPGEGLLSPQTLRLAFPPNTNTAAHGLFTGASYTQLQTFALHHQSARCSPSVQHLHSW